MENANLTIETRTRLAQFIAGANQVLPIVILIWAIIGSVFGYWLFNRDAQTVSAQTIKEIQTEQKNIRSVIDERKLEHDRQFEALEKKILTREIFEAYHQSDRARMDRMETLINRILENQIK